MSIDTIKQNAEILNEAIIKFNSFKLELDSLQKNKQTTKDISTKKVIDEQIMKTQSKLSELTNYIIKIQMNIQKLIDEELSGNAVQHA